MANPKRSTKRRLWGKGPFALCYWCDYILDYASATIDHVIPLALGGTYEDCVLACYQCNQQRGTLTSVVKMELRAKQYSKRKWKQRLVRLLTPEFFALKEKWELIHKAKGFDFEALIELWGITHKGRL